MAHIFGDKVEVGGLVRGDYAKLDGEPLKQVEKLKGRQVVYNNTC